MLYVTDSEVFVQPKCIEVQMLELIPEKIWIKNREHKVEMAKRFHLLQEDTYQFCVEENLEYLFRPKRLS